MRSRQIWSRANQFADFDPVDQPVISFASHPDLPVRAVRGVTQNDRCGITGNLGALHCCGREPKKMPDLSQFRRAVNSSSQAVRKSSRDMAPVYAIATLPASFADSVPEESPHPVTNPTSASAIKREITRSRADMAPHVISPVICPRVSAGVRAPLVRSGSPVTDPPRRCPAPPR